MNRIYQLIWRILCQTWIAFYKFILSCERTDRVSVVMILSSVLFSNETVAETQHITLPGDGIDYNLKDVAQLDGIEGTNSNLNGTDGKAAYIFETDINSSAEDNVISVNKGIAISGGNGGNGKFDEESTKLGMGGYGGEAINGDRLKINSSGTIRGG